MRQTWLSIQDLVPLQLCANHNARCYHVMSSVLVLTSKFEEP